MARKVSQVIARAVTKERNMARFETGVRGAVVEQMDAPEDIHKSINERFPDLLRTIMAPQQYSQQIGI